MGVPIQVLLVVNSLVGLQTTLTVERNNGIKSNNEKLTKESILKIFHSRIRIN